MSVVVRNAALVLVSFGFAIAIAHAAAIPADKATLEIDLIPGKKGKVAFEHAKHATVFKKAGGAGIVCGDCHHTVKGDEKPKPCSDCHAAVGNPEKTIGQQTAPALAASKSSGKVDRKSIIFHKQCVDGCHKAMKAEGKKITSCKICHP